MKKIIDGMVYDTEKAESVAEIGFSTQGDFAYWSDELMKTKNGNWFLYCSGGPASMYAKAIGNGTTSGSSHIQAVSKEEAHEWLMTHNKVETIEEHFPDKIPQDA